ncbi:MAG: 3-phosphoshikimate 1-carboxyvinyltransferase [Deltaproteobacteria bacterium]|nr:3-phosphoshikimate 1-carboxyvinyltransferase [Deltaproteobacteria bacterium]MBW2136205.1 3-phosphoshikimate 1-carboxyvinyltransferase [Deltaproteobacteria bacterium]
MPWGSETSSRQHPGPVRGRVKIPGSKSVSHRALIAAALASGVSVLDNLLICEDTLYTVHGLKELGAKISLERQRAQVWGTGGRFCRNTRRKEIFLGNSGTSYRLLLSVCALAQGEYVLTGTARMRQRPVGGLVSALRDLGVKVSCREREGFPPVLVRAGGIKGGGTRIRGIESSQYVSSLLLSGPYMNDGLRIQILEKQVSRPYIGITVNLMEDFGVRVERSGDSIYGVRPGKRYSARHYVVEGDVSSASYFWAAAAVTGGTVVTENIAPFVTVQGDIALLDILEDMGCVVTREANKVTVRGNPLTGVDVDMGSLPDMVPTLAAIAPFAKGRTVIRNVSHLRHKESDRLQAIVTQWRRLGIPVEELDDGIIIRGVQGDLKGACVDPHGDHRIAMSLAVISLNVPALLIKDNGCVGKSFPTFWQLWQPLARG